MTVLEEIERKLAESAERKRVLLLKMQGVDAALMAMQACGPSEFRRLQHVEDALMRLANIVDAIVRECI